LFRNIVYVPNYQELRNLVLKKMHNVPYVGHPGYPENYFKRPIFLASMKKDVVDYLSRCMEC
jgi:hypothetical protein